MISSSISATPLADCLPERAAADRVFGEADHLHVMGSSLSSAEHRALNVEGGAGRSRRAAARSRSIRTCERRCFDAPGMREAVTEVLTMTDLFLPCGEELFLLNGGAGLRAGAVAELLRRRISTIVHKHGSAGAAVSRHVGRRFICRLRGRRGRSDRRRRLFRRRVHGAMAAGTDTRQGAIRSGCGRRRPSGHQTRPDGGAAICGRAPGGSCAHAKARGQGMIPPPTRHSGRPPRGDPVGITSVCSAHPS